MDWFSDCKRNSLQVTWNRQSINRILGRYRELVTLALILVPKRMERITSDSILLLKVISMEMIRSGKFLDLSKIVYA